MSKYSPNDVSYQHTQRSPLQLLLYLPAILAVVFAWQIRNEVLPSAIVAVVGVTLLLLSLSFQTLTVTGYNDHLDIRYGPLNIFGTRIRHGHGRITAAVPDKSSIIDGWGIHFIPSRGWTINLWGFECVKVTLGNKVIRIGTDDSENLAAYLTSRINRNVENS